MEDKEIIELFRARSESAIEAAQQKYGAYCNTIAYNILDSSEDAEECVSDVLLRLWNAIPPAAPNCLRAFAGKITRNLALDRYEKLTAGKRGGGQTALALDELSECIPSPEDQTAPGELGTLLDSFLADLDKEDRVIFVRRYWYMEAVKNIADDLGFSESKVKTSLYRTRGRLRAQLSKEGISI